LLIELNADSYIVQSYITLYTLPTIDGTI